jgi:His/Glu/Gln/Arg/opine family amino acid ABC transporter permease subunit
VDISIIQDSIPRLLQGAMTTVELTVVSLTIGLCLAVPFAVMRTHRNPLLWMPIYVFNFYFRGTPLLVQIFLIYYGSGQFQLLLTQAGLWTIFQKATFCAVLTLTLNTAAYTCEILRGGIEAIPFGEIEAARACGMSGLLLYRRIILPKAFRLAWPAYTNEVVFLLQATSLVSIITVMDITGVARMVASRSFAFYEIYITAAVLYLILVYGVLFLFQKVECRLSGHLRSPLLRG